MQNNVLVSWIGFTDLVAAGLRQPPRSFQPGEIGPIARAIRHRKFSSVFLLDDGGNGKGYQEWLESLMGPETRDIRLNVYPVDLENRPTDPDIVYKAAQAALDELFLTLGTRVNLTYNLSPGTPTMAQIWFLLSRTVKYRGELIETWKGPEEFRTVRFPFRISVEYDPRPAAKGRERDVERSVVRLSDTQTLRTAIFAGPEMEELKRQIAKAATVDLPVLLLGETGTGKELAARLIHENSSRSKSRFVPVNCGGLPAELADSELFGHEKGAYTGANVRRIGAFEEAGDGTVFLDEIGDMPRQHQVKLLRALQERRFRRLAGKEDIALKARVITATHRDLMQAVAAGSFREDLLYRIMVVVVKIPPLRHRSGHRKPLIEALLMQINQENIHSEGFPKTLSPEAEQLLIEYHWPGNVRELDNTLKRAAWYTDGSEISKAEVEQATINVPGQVENILDLPLTDALSHEEILARVELHYMERALQETKGNKTAASKLLGYNKGLSQTNPVIFKGFWV
ncbi:MAG: sigma-54-dependent Fis family transcriptional regulator [Deltaproteobacteria bacterium]|nr:sigma-54-dependent Fis family transcriptional regulator [Deltaproteobacteria bacterium]